MTPRATRGFVRPSAQIILLSIWLLAATRAQTIRYAPPEFGDAGRGKRIEAVLPEVDKTFAELAQNEHFPGLVYGVMIDGQLIHARGIGFANLERKIPVTTETAFRIASMSKSFVTLAILKLRDDGKLNLDDPVGKFLPEFRKVKPPTKDSPAVTVRNLMTMTTGLPEDNPWGDRQMAISKQALREFVSGGLSFSSPPGQEYEYSNLGYVLLGHVITKASGISFQKYINTKILRPLGMLNTRWEYTEVPDGKLALGYRWEHGAWRLEPILPDGEGAACGGLITTLDDFSKYVRLHLDAWPARDDPETGPVRRATLREMHKPGIFSGISPRATLLNGTTPNPSVSFYGYGLSWSIDSRRIAGLAHAGGLPGFGSYYRFLPDYGVAVIAFANRTYAPAGAGANKAWNLLVENARLTPRSIAVSEILATRKSQVADLVTSWSVRLGEEIVAENFFLDRAREDWIKISQETFAKAGKITSIGAITPQNQLRGTFPMIGEKGRVNVSFTLTPEKVPKVQELRLNFVANPP